MSAARAAEQHSPLQAVLPHVLNTFKREPALALTVAYLMIVLAGIYYDYGFYQRGFGIPVLTLAQVGDFLVAGLQQPVAIVLVVVTLPLCWVMDRVSMFFRRREHARRVRLRAQPRLAWPQALYLRYLDWHLQQRWGMYAAYLVVVFVYGWIFVGAYAKQRVAEVKRGEAPQAAVRLAGADGDLAAGTAATWTYLGAVSNYVFLYDHVARRAMILPVNAIARIQPAMPPHPGPVAARP